MGSEVAADIPAHTCSLMNYLTYIKNIYGSEISGPGIENSVKLGMNSSLKGHMHMHAHTHTHTEMWILMPSTSWTPSDNNKLILLQTTDLCGGGTRRQPTSQWAKFIIKLQHIHTQFPLYF